nr:hypothetical protein BaRGS_002184 [Batillaria attramentaria]
MEKTTMFYGTYHNRTFNHGTKDSYNYNMGLAYLLSMVAIFLVSFILIVTNSSQAVKDAIRSDEEHSSVHFTNSVLCGWDFCINNEKSARDKKRILVQEFKADLTEQSKRMERLSRTGKQKLIRFLIRLIINILILAMLGGCLFLIYYTTNKLLELRKVIRDPLLMLVVQFVPSMTITVLNYIMPVVFDVLVAVEDYLPATSVKVTLVRWVLLRLSSLGVLLVALYYTLQVEDDEAKIFNCPEEGTTSVTRCCSNLMWSTSDQNGTSALSDVKCWETYLGQQFYKLCIVDYAVLFLKTFLVEFPRK